MPVANRRPRRNDDLPTVFVGWYRYRGDRRWWILCLAMGWNDAWRKLLDRMPHADCGGDSVVLSVPREP